MKLLRITADGLPLFKKQLDICLYAQQRTSGEQRNTLYPLFSNIYLNLANGLIGINASGKTSVLKLVLLSLGIINNEPINHIETKDILGNTKQATLHIFFYSETNREVCHLETKINSLQTDGNSNVYKFCPKTYGPSQLLKRLLENLCLILLKKTWLCAEATRSLFCQMT